MDMYTRYGLTKVINASGSFTPLGVSRSSSGVASAAADALQDFFIIDELQNLASKCIAEHTGAEAAAVVHCAAAAVTLSIAAIMTEGTAERVAALPDTRGMRNCVVLPSTHAVNYGHPIVQDVRLAGAIPVLAGRDYECSLDELDAALSNPAAACLLLVSSRLVWGAPLDISAAVALAKAKGIPVIIDGAAQDMRIPELLATGADAVIISAHKYLASPTAWLVIGTTSHIAAVRAQEKGIGRSMKASKEGIIGVLAALEERRSLDAAAWRQMQDEKLAAFLNRIENVPGIRASSRPDPAGMPFSRIVLTVFHDIAGMSAGDLARALRDGTPSIWVMEHNAAAGELMLELVPLNVEECDLIAERLRKILGQAAS